MGLTIEPKSARHQSPAPIVLRQYGRPFKQTNKQTNKQTGVSYNYLYMVYN